MSTSLHDIPRKRAGGDRHRVVTQSVHVPTGKNAGQISVDAHTRTASEGDGGLSAAISLIMLRHREYRGLQQAVGDMERRIKSETRWAATRRVYPDGPPTYSKGEFKFPTPNTADLAAIKRLRARYFVGLHQLTSLRNDCLKELLVPASMLPVQQFVKNTKGFALPSLVAIVAHAGDLSNYSGPAKLWKRFSLHVVDGAASRRVKGSAAELQQFVPLRRAEMHVIGDTMLRARGEYADLYRERKAYEIAKLAEHGIKVLPQARIPRNQDGFMSQGQVHKRALRYIEKRLLRELWRTWREASVIVSPMLSVPPADSNRIARLGVRRREAAAALSPNTAVPLADSNQIARLGVRRREAASRLSPTGPLPPADSNRRRGE